MNNIALISTLKCLEERFVSHGFGGRVFCLRHWLAAGKISNDKAARMSVIVRREWRPEPYAGFAALRKDSPPFCSILIETLPSGIAWEDAQDKEIYDNICNDEPDIHLWLKADCPALSAANIGAASSASDILIFINGEAMPLPGFLDAWQQAFSDHPEMLTGRGRVDCPQLAGCAIQATGSFALAEETVLWPLDLDDNMAVRAQNFFELGGFDDSLPEGFGSLDFSIRLFGRYPEFTRQRYVPGATLRWESEEDIFPNGYFFTRQRSWLTLNESMKRYLDLYGKFWKEKTAAVCNG